MEFWGIHFNFKRGIYPQCCFFGLSLVFSYSIIIHILNSENIEIVHFRTSKMAWILGKILPGKARNNDSYKASRYASKSVYVWNCILWELPFLLKCLSLRLEICISLVIPRKINNGHPHHEEGSLHINFCKSLVSP